MSGVGLLKDTFFTGDFILIVAVQRAIPNFDKAIRLVQCSMVVYIAFTKLRKDEFSEIIKSPLTSSTI